MVSIFEELVVGLDLDEMKTIEGLSRYEFDLKNGRIYDLKQEEWLNPSPSKARGYCYVNLQKDNKDRKVASVHSLILLAALDGFDFRKFYKGLNLVLDHKNRKRDDNRFINLNIVPQSKNLEGRQTKPKRLSDEKLQELYKDFILVDKAKHGSKHDTYNYLADKYGCSSHTVQVKYLEFKKVQ